MNTIIKDWKFTSLFASLLIAFGVAKAELAGLRTDVDSLQAVHPDAIASEVQQHSSDLKDMKATIEKISADTGYTRGKVDGLDTRLNESNERLQRLERWADMGFDQRKNPGSIGQVNR